MTTEFWNSRSYFQNEKEAQKDWKLERTYQIFARLQAINEKAISEHFKLRQLKNKLNKKNPMKLWTSNWLNNNTWTDVQLIDIAGLASSFFLKLLFIVLFYKFRVFTRIHHLWLYGSTYKRILCLLGVLSAFVINFICKLVQSSPSTDIHSLVIFRFLLLIIITPFSVLLEWVAWKIFLFYIKYSISCILNALSPVKD